MPVAQHTKQGPPGFPGLAAFCFAAGAVNLGCEVLGAAFVLVAADSSEEGLPACGIEASTWGAAFLTVLAGA